MIPLLTTTKSFFYYPPLIILNQKPCLSINEVIQSLQSRGCLYFIQFGSNFQTIESLPCDLDSIPIQKRYCSCHSIVPPSHYYIAIPILSFSLLYCYHCRCRCRSLLLALNRWLSMTNILTGLEYFIIRGFIRLLIRSHFRIISKHRILYKES